MQAYHSKLALLLVNTSVKNARYPSIYTHDILAYYVGLCTLSASSKTQRRTVKHIAAYSVTANAVKLKVMLDTLEQVARRGNKWICF